MRSIDPLSFVEQRLSIGAKDLEPQLISHLDAAGCQELVARGVIDAGMIPKVEACLDSLRAGVGKTHMIDGRLRHSLLLEIYTDRGVGTEIVLGLQP